MIRILCVGRLRADHYKAAVEDYARRLRRFARLEIVEIADSDPQREGREILAKLGGARTLVCDSTGDNVSSPELARELGAKGAVDFVLGGPDGLDASVLQHADRRIAFGRITLPHELARVVLLEQIYRGFSLLRGHPYHR